MARVLIVGFGNPLRSDDGVGWHVAQQLSREPSRNDVQVIAAQQLTPDLAEAASRSAKLVFVDASREGEPGDLNCRRVEPAASPGRFSHELSPASLLQLARELYGRSPDAYLLTITGETFETGDTMSSTVIAALPALMARVNDLMNGDPE